MNYRPQQLSRNSGMNEILLGFLFVNLILVIFLCFSPECRHWFVIPIALCGILVSADAVRWFLGKYDALDVYGLLGVYSVLFFFIIPCFQIATQIQPAYMPHMPDDFRPWFGYMAIINFFSLLVFFITRNLCGRRPIYPKTTWQVDAKAFYILFPAAIVLSWGCQLLVFRMTGGIFNIIDRSADLSGMGAVFMLSEPFSVLLFVGYILRSKIHRHKTSSTVTWTLFLICVSFAFLFTGLRGSRSNFLLQVMTLLVIIHWTQFQIPRKWFVLMAVPIALFLVVYGLYKNVREDITIIRSFSDYTAASEETGRTWQNTVVGDLGRSDIQALILWHLQTHGDYQVKYGETYVAAMTILIPQNIRPELCGKIQAGTEIWYGTGAYVAGEFRSSRIYGLAGEAMLNFGVLGVPFLFAVAGILVSWFRRFVMALSSDDLRLFFCAIVLRFVATIWMNDLDNNIFGIVKNGGLILLLIFLVSEKLRK